MAKIGKRSITKRYIIQFVILLLLFVIFLFTLYTKLSEISFNKSVISEYQPEINSLIPSDFILISSTVASDIDVGTRVTEDYTTHLPSYQAVRVIDATIQKKGYVPNDYDMGATCLGGPLAYSSKTASALAFCVKKIENGVTTIEIELNNFSKVPSQNIPSQCVGDCKN